MKKTDEILNYKMCLGRSLVAKGKMFTLYVDIGYGKLQFSQILGRDYKESLEKANEITKGHNLEVMQEATNGGDFEYLPINFGKYKGRDLKWLEENDLDYLFWIAENMDYLKYKVQEALAVICDKHKKDHRIVEEYCPEDMMCRVVGLEKYSTKYGDKEVVKIEFCDYRYMFYSFAGTHKIGDKINVEYYKAYKVKYINGVKWKVISLIKK